VIVDVAKKVLDKTAELIRPYRWTRPRGSLAVLAYHRVLPRKFTDGVIVEPGMFVHDDTFETHLAVIRKEFDIVNLGEWVRAVQGGQAVPKRACAITFDDGWRDNYQYAFPLLKAAGLTATVFITSSMLGTRRQFWPDKLVRLVSSLAGSDWHEDGRDSPAASWLSRLVVNTNLRGLPLDQESAARLIALAKQTDDETISRNLDEAAMHFSVDLDTRNADMLDWSELKEMMDSGIFSVGSHTCNHVRLNAGLDVETLHREVVASKHRIEGEIGSPVDLFCYPNGDFDGRAERLVRENYSGACTVQMGWTKSDDDPYRIKRLLVHEDRCRSKASFLSRLSGWY